MAPSVPTPQKMSVSSHVVFFRTVHAVFDQYNWWEGPLL
jgi:hypothetical protein